MSGFRCRRLPAQLRVGAEMRTRMEMRRARLPLIILPNTALTSEEPEEGDREEYCLRMSAISLRLPEGRERENRKREQGFGPPN